MNEHRGMTRADVVGLMISGMLLAMLVPVLLAQESRNSELNNRKTCAANLRGLSQSMNVYAADNNDFFPLFSGTSETAYDVTLKKDEGPANADKVASAVYESGKYLNNPYVNLWMLVMNGQVSAKQFLCKSDPFFGEPAALYSKVDEAGKPTADSRCYLNFQSPKNVSYSTIYPWVKKNGFYVAGGWWTSQTDASLPIMSDMAPYLSGTAKAEEVATRPAGAAINPKEDWPVQRASSQNHQFDGQNVAFSDAHVEFSRRADIGQGNESIWGAREKKTKKEVVIEAGTLPERDVGSMGAYDTVMVPTRDAKGNLK
jgi:hypothetical protein